MFGIHVFYILYYVFSCRLHMFWTHYCQKFNRNVYTFKIITVFSQTNFRKQRWFGWFLYMSYKIIYNNQEIMYIQFSCVKYMTYWQQRKNTNIYSYNSWKSYISRSILATIIVQCVHYPWFYIYCLRLKPYVG